MNNLKIKLQKFYNTKYGMVAAFAGLFLITVGISWFVFSFIIKSPSTVVSSTAINTTRSKINPNLPKTEPCPINGQLYTAEEKAIWMARRPAVVMVENNIDARPLNGLSKADFIYEAVTEGGITRFAAVYYCGVSAESVNIAPVRSARVHFIEWAQEYGDKPLYAHVGGANDYGDKAPGDIDPRVNALSLLDKIGWSGGNNFDGGTNAGVESGFTRTPDRLGPNVSLAYEHTMNLSSDTFFASAQSKGFGYSYNGVPWTKGFVPYNFVNDAKSATPNASDIKFDFWTSEQDYSVEWKYNSKDNNYLRFTGGKPFTDIDYNNIQLTGKNIIVMYVQETGPVDNEKHMIEQNIGMGKGFLFQNGTATPINWSKPNGSSRTIFTDNNGTQINLVRGVTWVEAVPSENTVNYH